MSKQDEFYHVFLSFRGETRNKFTCFLYEALKAQGFVAFMDKCKIRVGDEVDSTIKDGIKKSMSAIIIFSPDYAYSTWCLDELVLILERNKNSRYFIMPIFYDVETQDIKHQLGKYGSALEKHMARHGSKVEKWKQALFEVGNILGKHVEGQQTTFIRGAVKLFREKLAAKFPELQVALQSPTRDPSKDQVIMYTTNACNSPLRTKSVQLKKVLAGGNVVFEERNCSKEPKYILELMDYDKVRYPKVIVNGKDLCKEEEVESLDDFEYALRVGLMLEMMFPGESISKFVEECFEETGQFLGECVDETDEFLDECFEETGQFLGECVEETDECFEETSEFLDECFEETGQFLEECFEETGEFLDECFEETEQFLDKSVDKITNKFMDLFSS